MDGAARERQLKERLCAEGWWCIRPAGSHGEADIVALRDGKTPRMIQLKANKDGGPYKNFGPAERAQLVEAAKIAGAQAFLVYWPARAHPQFIPADAFPT